MKQQVAHVKDLNTANPVNYVYLVGGFAESKMLQMRVKTELQSANPGLRVIVPMRPQLMVVKGAVLFGLQKGSTIQSRVARSTYGFALSESYDASNPDHTRRGSREFNGETYVKVGRFERLVKQGSTVKVLESHTSVKCNPIEKDSTTIHFRLYSSSNPDVKFVDEASVIRIGEVTVPCIYEQKSTLAMLFGSTEITATATNLFTGVICQADITYDFNSL